MAGPFPQITVADPRATQNFEFNPPTVLTLPATPEADQVIHYQTATAGRIWTFRYNVASTSAYKWEWIGGSELTALDTSARTFNPGTDFNAVAGSPVAVTVPLAGDYIVEFGSYMENQGGAAVNGITAPRFGAPAASVDDGFNFYLGSGLYMSGWRRVERAGVAAGTSISMEHRNAASVNMQVARRSLSVRPIRVG